jgi:hypothetical protein
VPSNALLCCDTAVVIYRCPDTGLNVQGWFADDGAANEGEVYEAMTCAQLYARVHLVNAATGIVLGAEE